MTNAALAETGVHGWSRTALRRNEHYTDVASAVKILKTLPQNVGGIQSNPPRSELQLERFHGTPE